MGFEPNGTIEASEDSQQVEKVNSVSKANESNDIIVSHLVNKLKQVVNNAFPGDIWIRGQITSLSKRNGHYFFDLADPQEENALDSFHQQKKASSISCCLWKGVASNLEVAGKDLSFLEEGLEVRFKIYIDLYAEMGRINCIIQDVDPEYTLGNLALQRKNIVLELKRRGLYNKNKQHFLPDIPLRIALITADGSRAKSDFLHELEQSGLGFHVDFIDSRMQGEMTQKNVCKAFKMVQNRFDTELYHAVVLTRGGGSQLDLRWFDDIEIAKQIAYCPCPVICAIGHHDDTSVAEEVSWRQVKTPTAAAQELIRKVEDSWSLVEMTFQELAQLVSERLTREDEKLKQLKETIIQSAQLFLADKEKELKSFVQMLELLSKNLQSTLIRGFALMNFEDNPVTGDTLVERDLQQLNIETHSKKHQKHIELKVNILEKNISEWKG